MNPITPCPERELLLHSLADGELDAANALAVEEHLRGCGGCSAAYGEIVRHKALLKNEELRFRPPPALQGRVLAAIASEEGAKAANAPARPPWPLQRQALSSLASRRRVFGHGARREHYAFRCRPEPTSDIGDQLVSAHVRSLLVSHLTDVASSDQHTVKPWFLGKLDFAPPVVDLAQNGFPLVGGRLDYLGGRVVPALVYRRHGHTINLFVWPAGKIAAAAETLDGYHVASWSQGGFAYAAVSDLNIPELQEFQRVFEQQAR